MTNIPKGLKSKYNKDSKFIWVDSQWEKFMGKQKELEARILELENKSKESSNVNPNQMNLFK